jgi:hypothetical protein
LRRETDRSAAVVRSFGLGAMQADEAQASGLLGGRSNDGAAAAACRQRKQDFAACVEKNGRGWVVGGRESDRLEVRKPWRRGRSRGWDEGSCAWHHRYESANVHLTACRTLPLFTPACIGTLHTALLAVFRCFNALPDRLWCFVLCDSSSSLDGHGEPVGTELLVPAGPAHTRTSRCPEMPSEIRQPASAAYYLEGTNCSA